MYLYSYIIEGDWKMMHILLFLLQGIPEMMGVFALSLALARVPLRWGRILLVGTVLASVVYFVRLLPVTFGLHTIAGVLLLAIFLVKATHLSSSKSFIVVIVSVVVLAILELLINEIFLAFTKLELSEMISKDWSWKLLGFIQVMMINLLAVFVSRILKPVQGAWKF